MGTNFFNQIKQALERYTVSEAPSGWDALEKQLDQAMPVQKSNKGKGWLLGSIAFVAGSLGVMYLFLGTHEKPAVSSSQYQQTSSDLVSEVNVAEMENNADAGRSLDQSNVNPSSENQDQNIASSLPKSEEKKVEEVEIPEISASDLSYKTPVPSVKPNEATPVKPEASDKDFVFEIKYKREACEGEMVAFTSIPECAECTYEWDLGDGKAYSNSGSSLQAAFDAPGVYHITLKVILNGQSGFLKNTILINEKPQEDVLVKAEHNESIPEYHFSYNQAKMYSVTWSFSDGQKLFGTNCKRMFYEKRNETVSVKAVTDKGCKAEFTKSVFIDQPFTLLAPNSFSPNGDGKNDTWMPIVLQENKMSFTLQIMDIATKTLVYTTTNPNQGWDGRIQGTSRNAKMGQSFVWVAQVKINGQESKTFQGEIIVVE